MKAGARAFPPCVEKTRADRQQFARGYSLNPKRLARTWKAHLLAPEDGASIAALRVIFGLLMAWEVIRYIALGRIERYFISPSFHFTYPFFEFVKPWPGTGMYLHFAVVGILALLVAAGLFYRFAAPLFFLSFSYIFLLDKAYYLNHFYLILLISFLLTIIPAHRVFSLDRQLFSPTQPPTVPRWSILLLRAQIFILYFYAGVAKLNPDWLQGEPMRMWLAGRTDFPLIGSLFTEEWLVFSFSYGALFFDLAIGFLLIRKRSRYAAIALATGFHVMNAKLFDIGIFPYLAIGATLIFAEPDWPRRLHARLKSMIDHKRFSASKSPLRLPSPGSSYRKPRGSAEWALLAVGHLFVLSQLLIPLRHWLYPGDVSWTEEGHRFSWRMKLRDKEATLRVFVTDPYSADTWEISPAVDLSARQFDEMSTRPDMVLQYAQYVAERLSIPGRAPQMVRVDHRVSLNGRPYQPMIDPTVDLAAVSAGFSSATWILPLEMPLEGG